jgi:hypothetical protein
MTGSLTFVESPRQPESLIKDTLLLTGGNKSRPEELIRLARFGIPVTEHLRGCRIPEARRLYETFHQAILRPKDASGLASDLAVIAEIHRFPRRIECATLPWHTMNAVLNGGNGRLPGTSTSD